MKVHINLATEPFRKDRAMTIASSTLAVIMAGLFGLLIWLFMAERKEMASTRAEIGKLEAQVRTMSAEQSKLEALLRQPDNAEVLERAVFLNALLLRKGVSWTKIFNDLEGVLPHNVRLISVRPQIDDKNEIFLDMFVGSQSGEPVIDLLRKLESAPQFGSTAVHTMLPPTQNEPLYRYRVSVHYAQKL